MMKSLLIKKESISVYSDFCILYFMSQIGELLYCGIESDSVIGSVSIEEVDVEDGNRVDFQCCECGLCRHQLSAL